MSHLLVGSAGEAFGVLVQQHLAKIHQQQQMLELQLQLQQQQQQEQRAPRQAPPETPRTRAPSPRRGGEEVAEEYSIVVFFSIV